MQFFWNFCSPKDPVSPQIYESILSIITINNKKYFLSTKSAY